MRAGDAGGMGAGRKLSAIAADAAIDVTNPQHMDWHLLADDAIGKAIFEAILDASLVFMPMPATDGQRVEASVVQERVLPCAGTMGIKACAWLCRLPGPLLNPGLHASGEGRQDLGALRLCRKGQTEC